MDTNLKHHELISVALPEEHVGAVGRRSVLKFILGTYAIGLVPPVVNALNIGLTSISAINSREKPVNTKNLEDLAKDFLGPEDLGEIYARNIAGFVDPMDAQPIITSKGFENLMGLIQVITRLQYDQIKDESKKIPYKEYVNEFIQDTCEMSQAMGIHPDVFLITQAFSGMNVSFRDGQAEDVNVYRAQLGIGALHEIIGKDRTLGIDSTKFIQNQFVDEDSYIFSEEGRGVIETFAKLINPDIVLDDTYTELNNWQAIRLNNPTVGSMDLELIIYAKGLVYVLKNFPEAEKYFSQFPEAVNALKNLADAEKLMEFGRSNLKTKASEFVRAYPETFDDFFNPEKAEEAFRQIGIGKVNFTYSVDTYNGVIFDNNQPPRKKYSEQKNQKREEFVVRRTAEYFVELAKKDKKAASEALIADQIFNNDFVNYLEEKTNIFATVPLQLALKAFEDRAALFRRFRLRSYEPLAKLEYDRKFQLALAIATNKKLLEDVKQVYPEVGGDTRSQLQWQAYFIGMIREISAFPTLISNFLRPDEDPPYNTQEFLKRFRPYYQNYVDEGLMHKNSLPMNYEKFALVELCYIATKRGANTMFLGITPEMVEEINAKQTEFNGKLFSGWTRMHRICFLLDITIPDNYFGPNY